MADKEKNPRKNPLLAAVTPLARQYVNAENINRVFDNITANLDLQPGEKAAIILSRGTDGRVGGAVYGINGSEVTSQYSDRVPVDELILQLLK